jgi:hypothetical protein
MSTIEGADVRRLRLKPGDTIVLSTHARITPQIAADLKRSAEARWPDHPIVILERLDIAVVELDTPPAE